MRIDRYDVFFNNGEMKSFNAQSVVHAWIRGMSYTIIVNKELEIKHIVNHATLQIFSDFIWDISFSLKDTAYETGNPIMYTEDEVREKFSEYSKYIGSSTPTFATNWFERTKKLK